MPALNPLPETAETFRPEVLEPFPFLLEGCGWGGTLFGSDPYAVLVARGDRLSLWREGRERTFRGNPFDVLEELLRESKPREASPFPSAGAAVGALGYDLGRHLERLPRRAVDDLGFPDLVVGFYDRLTVVSPRGELRRIERRGRRPGRAIDPGTCAEVFTVGRSDLPKGPNFTRQGYLEAIARAKRYIAAGDIYQVNLSQRFHARVSDPPWETYRRLRAASPAPFSGYLCFGNQAILSSSPELFLQLRGRRLTTRPIKGTRPRGATPDEDERLRRELQSSPKDDAELAMIVDLERNDLGRVCEYGTVKVTAPKELESHPTVHHLVATVEGRLRKGLGPVDVLRATFPGGSVTGAPKIRAMEIIDELEPTRRAFYTGAIGYFGPDGSMTLSVAIRIAMAAGPDYYFQAGGGIVADSDPASEYEETLAKAAALARALEIRLP